MIELCISDKSNLKDKSSLRIDGAYVVYNKKDGNDNEITQYGEYIPNKINKWNTYPSQMVAECPHGYEPYYCIVDYSIKN